MTIYVISNLCIAWMFVLIGLTLAYVGCLIRRRGLAILISLRAADKARQIGWVMSAVFLFCAGGHVIENVGAFWWPAYHFFAIWHLMTLIATAIASLKVANWGIRILRAERAANILEAARKSDS